MEAQDYIALVVLMGGFTLLALGIDSLVGGILIAVISYYFGMGRYEKNRNSTNR
ncbi:MAG: hypothetical protein GTN74_05100 [Proteobacteria bacterium]|nr:hypothetical protein [Pseudomonadota bacterium]